MSDESVFESAMNAASEIDIAGYNSRFSLGNKLRRLCWGVAWGVLGRLSPRPFFAWRRGLLRCFGAQLDHNVNVYPTSKIWAPWNLEMGDYACLGPDVDCYNMARITIGANATVSQYAFLCTGTHDVSDANMRLVSKPIIIGQSAWICAGAFVAPGVQIGEGAVVGARACVFKDVAAWTIVGGNPAQFLKPRVLAP